MVNSRVMALIAGKMVKYIKDNIKMDRKMVMGLFIILLVNVSSENGRIVGGKD